MRNSESFQDFKNVKNLNYFKTIRNSEHFKMLHRNSEYCESCLKRCWLPQPATPHSPRLPSTRLGCNCNCNPSRIVTVTPEHGYRTQKLLTGIVTPGSQYKVIGPKKL